MSTFFGFGAPFLGGPQNIMSRQEDDKLIKNDILSFLLTVPGERVMRPTFGVNLRNIIFDPSDDETINSIEVEIQNALLDNDRRLGRVDVNIEISDDNQLTLHVTAQLRDDPEHYVTVDQVLGTVSGL